MKVIVNSLSRENIEKRKFLSCVFVSFVSLSCFKQLVNTGVIIRTREVKFHIEVEHHTRLNERKKRIIRIEIDGKLKSSEKEANYVYMAHELLKSMDIKENEVIILKTEILKFRVPIIPKLYVSVVENNDIDDRYFVRCESLCNEILFDEVIFGGRNRYYIPNVDVFVEVEPFGKKESEMYYVSKFETEFCYSDNSRSKKSNVENMVKEEYSEWEEMELSKREGPIPPKFFLVYGDSVMKIKNSVILKMTQEMIDRLKVLTPSNFYSEKELVSIDKGLYLITFMTVCYGNDKDSLRKFTEFLERCKLEKVLVIGICEDAEYLNPYVRKLFDHEISLSRKLRLDFTIRFEKLRKMLMKKDTWNFLEDSFSKNEEVRNQQILRFNNLFFGSENDLRLFLKHYSNEKTRSNFVNEFDVFYGSFKIFKERFLDQWKHEGNLKGINSQQIVPSVKWSEIGGLQNTKKVLRENLVFPFKHYDVMQKFLGNSKFNIFISGVLLYGPPGTGKTMLAKAVATETSSNFIFCNIPDLIHGEVGASEKELSRIFRDAKLKEPCVLFFDELQSIFGKKRDMDPNERKLVSQFLLEFDGLKYYSANQRTRSYRVLVIAATNLPHFLDESLFRAGRFEKLIYVGLPDNASRKRIFEIELSKLKMSEEFYEKKDESWIEEFVERSKGFSGADISNICQKAGLVALRNDRSFIKKGDFMEVFEVFTPSVDENYVKKMKEFRELHPNLRN